MPPSLRSTTTTISAPTSRGLRPFYDRAPCGTPSRPRNISASVLRALSQSAGRRCARGPFLRGRPRSRAEMLLALRFRQNVSASGRINRRNRRYRYRRTGARLSASLPPAAIWRRVAIDRTARPSGASPMWMSAWQRPQVANSRSACHPASAPNWRTPRRCCSKMLPISSRVCAALALTIDGQLRRELIS